VDLNAVLLRGGTTLLDLLQFCVLSVQPAPLFVFLVQEYRQTPRAASALALYDAFCAPAAPARVEADIVLAPRDLRLHQAIEAVRRQVAWAAAPLPPVAEGEQPPPRRFVPIPPAHLFDPVVSHLRDLEDGPLARVSRDYNPDRAPLENLPGGKMNASQRFFVDNIWRPRLRPQLVAAGFWRIATVGG
jgi:hypothetical protein